MIFREGEPPCEPLLSNRLKYRRLGRRLALPNQNTIIQDAGSVGASPSRKRSPMSFRAQCNAGSVGASPSRKRSPMSFRAQCNAGSVGASPSRIKIPIYKTPARSAPRPPENVRRCHSGRNVTPARSAHRSLGSRFRLIFRFGRGIEFGFDAEPFVERSRSAGARALFSTRFDASRRRDFQARLASRSHLLSASAASIAETTLGDSGFSRGSNRPITSPFRFTKNLAKFQVTSPPNFGFESLLVKNA